MRRLALPSLGLALLLSPSIGCIVDRRAPVPLLDLPSAAELQAIANSELGVLPHDPAAGVRVERWELATPLPAAVADAPPAGDSLAEQVTRALAGGGSGRPSQAMSCVARELGRFALAHDAYPTAPLRQFILHRCGASSLHVRTQIHRWPVHGPEPTGDAIVEALRLDGAGPVGAWLGANDSRRIGVAVRGEEQQLELEPMSMLVDDERVELRGQVGPHEWISAAITRGQYGVGACKTLAADAGEFHIVCPALARDRGAFVDINVADPGRWLSSTRARIWVSPDGSLPRVFEDPAWSRTPAPVDPDEDRVALTLEIVNGLREHLDAPPLRLELAQSERFDQLRPHYRSAAVRGDFEQLDTIARGLHAGWDLSTRVVHGRFRQISFEDVQDRRHLLESILLSPSARFALLDPALGLIALSLEPADADEIQWGYLGSWVPAPAQTHRTADEEWMFDLVDVARSHAGLPDMYRIGGRVHDILERAADEVAAGTINHKRGLSLALRELAEDQQVPISGLVWIAQDLRTIEAPNELLRDDVVQMAVHVRQIDAQDSNWARLLVYVAYVYDTDLPAVRP